MCRTFIAVTVVLWLPSAYLGPASAAQPKAQEAAAALVRGDAAQAVASYSDALADQSLPNDRRAILLNDRGVAYARLGQPKLALEDFNRAVRLFPEYAAIYNNRGAVLIDLGAYAEAAKDFDRAIVLAPGYAAAYNNRAGLLLRQGNTQGAIRDYTSAIRLMPGNAAPLSGRGRVHLSTGRPYAAIRDFSRAVGADARFVSAYLSRAEANLAIGQYDEAIEDLSRAIGSDASNPDLYIVRGHAHLASGKLVAASQDFARVIELMPTSGLAHEGRGLVQALMENYDAAFADLNRALEIDPRSAIAFAYRGYVYKQTGQLDVGEKDIDTAAKIAPDKAEVLWVKAEIEDAAGQRETAIALLRRALVLKPGYKLAADGLERRGVPPGTELDKIEPGLGFDPWQVATREGRYFAISNAFPRLRVPLEPLGEGQPRLLAWELKPLPYKGIGLLRYHGGTRQTSSGSEDVEMVAVVNTITGKVLAVTPDKVGSTVASWTWQDDKVVVASADGVTDEFAVGSVRERSFSRTSSGSQSPAPRRRRSKSLFDFLFN